MKDEPRAYIIEAEIEELLRQFEDVTTAWLRHEITTGKAIAEQKRLMDAIHEAEADLSH